ncbi:hypothetical protein CHARACLAT_004675 [Characodon lateralis]|uniref:Uncharacterized protein n=1 Tax=Characodon lateralis TaxID=208331 RepID=A0ABU7CVI1_9TELE|nr:hypothetical protein [Characodon lateralis]
MLLLYHHVSGGGSIGMCNKSFPPHVTVSKCLFDQIAFFHVFAVSSTWLVVNCEWDTAKSYPVNRFSHLSCASLVHIFQTILKKNVLPLESYVLLCWFIRKISKYKINILTFVVITGQIKNWCEYFYTALYIMDLLQTIMEAGEVIVLQASQVLCTKL